MPLKNLVSAGSVVVVADGNDSQKIAVVVDFLGTSRLIIDGPTSGVKRQVIGAKHLKLTRLKVRIPRGLKTSSLERKMKEQEIDRKWSETSWGNKIKSREVSKNMNDFDRFVKTIERKRTSRMLKVAVNKKRKEQNLTRLYLPKEATKTN